MEAYRVEKTAFNVTLAPNHTTATDCCDNNTTTLPSNLTGSYRIPAQDCFTINKIYQGNGGVCQKVMRDCTGGCNDPEMRKRIDQFCGPSATPGFYHNGAFWSIS
jgi:hypothetical protein